MTTKFQRAALPTAWPHITAWCIIAAVAIVCSVLLSTFVQDMNFQRTALSHGEWYRLITHAFWHTNTVHLCLNLAGIGVLWLLHGEYYSTKTTLSLVAFGIVFSAVCVWVYSPHIDHYVGLSATLHGVFAWGVCRDIQARRTSGVLLALGLCLKLVHEQWWGDATTAQLIEADVATMAHVYGAIAGCVFFAVQAAVTSVFRTT